ncbi:MAG: type I 3-dehydroquinate dehydratase [Candidatus Altiarchaeota archaeon]|nr:type I 3-dehydroquinate dehydratase [Candidatus Altiarchaeota archaeon]
MVKICVPIIEANIDDAVASLKRAKELGADIVEIRMDYLGALDETKIGELFDGVDIPKIATLRPTREGGFFKGDESTRVGHLLTAMSFGADYIDLEISTDIGWRYEVSKACKSNRTKMIVSFHDFKSTPPRDKLDDVVKNEFAAGADIAKLATTPQSFSDVMQLLTVVNEFSSKEKSVIGVAMGKLGRVSRILAGTAGSFLTYAALERGKESAEGQLTISEMKTIVEMLER